MKIEREILLNFLFQATEDSREKIKINREIKIKYS